MAAVFTDGSSTTQRDLHGALKASGVNPEACLEAAFERGAVTRESIGIRILRRYYSRWHQLYKSAVHPTFGMSFADMHTLLPTTGGGNDSTGRDLIKSIAKAHNADVILDPYKGRISEDTERRAAKSGAGCCMYVVPSVHPILGTLVKYDTDGRILEATFHPVRLEHSVCAPALSAHSSHSSSV